MRQFLAAIALAAASLPALAPAQAQPQAKPQPQPQPQPKWELVWSDEFNYQGLPDPAKWGYEVGFVRNGESQYYTKERLENARVEGGMLVIEGRKEQFPNAKHDPKKTKSGPEFAQYTAASLTTRGKASWTYGRIEVRAKLPQGLGVWPAVWMLGDNIGKVGWPRCGEIDIMEFVGKVPDKVYGTLHYSLNRKHAASGKELKVTAPFDDFHTYAVEWFPDHMDIFFDQQKYNTFPLSKADENGENPFNKPQYLLLNLALGGSWGGKIDDAILPQKYLIDYVRVYRDAAAPATQPAADR